MLVTYVARLERMRQEAMVSQTLSYPYQLIMTFPHQMHFVLLFAMACALAILVVVNTIVNTHSTTSVYGSATSTRETTTYVL